MRNSSAYLVLAIGTEIGKTYLTTNLCKKNQNIFAIKPVVSGFKNDNKSDSALILQALNFKINPQNLNLISPWRFSKPLSPNFAGHVDYQKLLEFCEENIKKFNKQNKTLLIEGAGGILSPITSQKTFMDVAKDLNLPVILLTANYLGSISHTLCSIEVFNSRKLKLEYLVLNNHNKPPISNKKFIECLKNFSNYNIVEIKNFIRNF